MNCRTCRNRRYVAPKGEPDMAMPCMKCNAAWVLPPPAKVPDADEPFPFGKYAGVHYSTMLVTQSSYLRWLAEQPWIKKWEAVYAFIDANRERLGID